MCCDQMKDNTRIKSKELYNDENVHFKTSSLTDLDKTNSKKKEKKKKEHSMFIELGKSGALLQ